MFKMKKIMSNLTDIYVEKGRCWLQINLPLKNLPSINLIILPFASSRSALMQNLIKHARSRNSFVKSQILHCNFIDNVELASPRKKLNFARTRASKQTNITSRAALISCRRKASFCRCMHLHRRTINWDVHSESHLSWGTHYQNLSPPDPIMASERYIALARNTYITYQSSALREIEKGGTNLWLLTVSCLLHRYMYYFWSSFIRIAISILFHISRFFLYLLISALLDFLGYLPLSRSASAILRIFSHVMLGHLSSMLQISFKDYADISYGAKASLKTMF